MCINHILASGIIPNITCSCCDGHLTAWRPGSAWRSGLENGGTSSIDRWLTLSKYVKLVISHIDMWNYQREGPQVGFGLRREEVGGVLGEEVKGDVKVLVDGRKSWEGGGGYGPPKREELPRKGGAERRRGDSLPTPSPGRGGDRGPFGVTAPPQ